MTVGSGLDGLALRVPLSRTADSFADLNRQGLDGLLTCALGLIGGAALLVSCADRSVSVVPAAPPAPAVVTEVAAMTVPPSPIPRTKPAAPPLPAPAEASFPATGMTMAPDPAPAPEVAIKAPNRPLALDPETLVGMSERDMVQLLGQPVWTEEIPPAKTWQYGNARCRLRVFLFMEMTTRDFRTLSYELSSTDGQPNVAQQCFTELVAEAWHP